MHLLRTASGRGPRSIELIDGIGGAVEEVTGVAFVVDAAAGVADDLLYRELDALATGPRVHLAGDANSPRTALEAVYEGRLAGALHTRMDDPTPALLALTR